MSLTDLDLDVDLTSGPARPLPEAALRDIACGVAGATTLWKAHVRRDPDVRQPVRLLATKGYEVWVIGWTEGQGVDMHDHGGSTRVMMSTGAPLVERAGGDPPRPLPAESVTELPRTVV